MSRHFDDPTLVIASHNPGKVREITALLEPFGVTIKSAAGLGLPEPEETGTTFTANAELKALAAASASCLRSAANNKLMYVWSAARFVGLARLRPLSSTNLIAAARPSWV